MSPCFVAEWYHRHGYWATRRKQIDFGTKRWAVHLPLWPLSPGTIAIIKLKALGSDLTAGALENQLKHASVEAI